MHRLTVTLVIVIGFAAVAYSGNIADLVSSLPVSSRKEILKQYYREELNDARDDRDLAEFVFPLEHDLSTDPQDVTGYVVRSKHVRFGLPKLTDDRYGSRDVSLLFREGFVVAFSQQLGSPIWVSQRWTRDNLSDKVDTPSLARDFVDDGEIPPEFHRGDSFKGNTTFLDRGHMAKHSMNRAWGFDASVAGCLMTNITPQHKDINQQPGGWHRLEESVEEIVSDSIVIDVVWTISGAVFQDQDNPPGESPTEDLENAARIFKWAVSEELAPPGAYEALRTVSGLRYGRTEARETDPVKPVPMAWVEAVLPHVSPQVSAMIQVQLLCGMRPGEVVIMRACEIDMSGDVWIYEPLDHKNRWRNHQKLVPLGPKAQEILKPFLKLDLTAFLFSPREAEEWRNTQRRRDRKSPMTPSQRKRKPKQKPKREKRDRYNVVSYRRAITYGIDKANKERDEERQIPNWCPLQLRHSRATEIRKMYGIEAAQVVLGHARADVTQVYAEKNLEYAVEIAKEIG